LLEAGGAFDRLCLTVLGNIITAVGWFGSNLNYSPVLPFTCRFLGAQLLLVIGLLPDQWLPSRQE
jgi:hypothetical protein